MKQKKILLIGGYGYQDIGDESQLTASLDSLKQSFPAADFLVLSDNPDDTAKYHNINSSFSIRRCFFGSLFPGRGRRGPAQSFAMKNAARVAGSSASSYKIFLKMGNDVKIAIVSLLLFLNVGLLKNSKRSFFLNDNQKIFLNNLISHDLLFCVGGGNITSYWHSEFFMKCLTFILCKVVGLPVILSGQTIGPINGKFDSCFAKYALNNVHVITLREETSMPVLKRVGIIKPVVEVTADDSLQLNSAPLSVLNRIVKDEYLVDKHPLIGFNIFGLPLLNSEVNLLKAKWLLANVADYLIEKYDASIVFVPMQYGDPDDRITELETLALMAHKEKAFVLENIHSDMELKGLIGQMDFAIGFRYHFVTFAVTSGVPAIGLYSTPYYSTKIRGVLSLMGLQDYALDLNKTSYSSLIALIDEVLANKRSIGEMLVNRTTTLRARSLLSIKYAANILNSESTKS
jgi:polysaccharide pyruvyl transferase WcaK-like protein